MVCLTTIWAVVATILPFVSAKNPFDSIVHDYSNVVLKVELAIALTVKVVSCEYIFRAITAMWYSL